MQYLNSFFSGNKSENQSLGWTTLIASVFSSQYTLQSELLNAIKKGSVEAVSIAIKKGAKVNEYCEQYADTALRLAVELERDEIIDLLLVHHADSKAKFGVMTFNPREESVRKGRVSFLENFISKNDAELDEVVELFELALDSKQMKNKKEMIHFLLSFFNETDHQFKCISQLAILRNDTEVMELIREKFSNYIEEHDLIDFCWRNAKSIRFVNYLCGSGMIMPSADFPEKLEAISCALINVETLKKDFDLFQYSCKKIYKRINAIIQLDKQQRVRSRFDEQLVMALKNSVNSDDSDKLPSLCDIASEMLKYHSQYSLLGDPNLYQENRFYETFFYYKELILKSLEKNEIALLDFLINYVAPENLLNLMFPMSSSGRNLYIFWAIPKFSSECLTLFLNKIASAIQMGTNEAENKQDINRIFDDCFEQKVKNLIALANDTKDLCYQDFFEFSNQCFFSENTIDRAKKRIDKLLKSAYTGEPILSESALDKLGRINHIIRQSLPKKLN